MSGSFCRRQRWHFLLTISRLSLSAHIRGSFRVSTISSLFSVSPHVAAVSVRLLPMWHNVSSGDELMSIVRMPGQAGVGWGLAAAFVLSAPTAIAQAKGFTIEQALSAPYASDLHAAPSRGRLEWEANIGGRRNLWVAEPAPKGKGYVSRQITHFTDDDGQEINTPEWTAEAASIVYVRGDSAAGENHPVPNPAGFPKGAQQQLWVV